MRVIGDIAGGGGISRRAKRNSPLFKVDITLAIPQVVSANFVFERMYLN